ncbi:hypothetical protein NKJ60_30000, partial [Mesorhizobium sp. M0085]
SARRFTRPAGHNPRRKRTQNWIETGGNVRRYRLRTLALFAKPETYRRSAPGIAEIAQEVLSLTKINWNSTQINQKLPIPILAARRVGELFKYLSEESISSDYRKYA